MNPPTLSFTLGFTIALTLLQSPLVWLLTVGPVVVVGVVGWFWFGERANENN